jgi:uncharacterized protein YdeI (YjbR/CyaY-like superfamily)
MNSSILHVQTRAEWRNWLAQNFDKETEVWLVNPNQSSGKKRILYNDTVEEALCFGWIDSTIRKLDAHHSMQRFTPRRPKSSFSQPNVERLKEIYRQQLIHPSVLPRVIDIILRPYTFPADILAELQKDPLVWEHYQRFPEGYRRLRISYINDARHRPEEFEKRLRNFMNKTRANKLIPGYGGISKYY